MSSIFFFFTSRLPLAIYLFGILRCFQHCTGHITTGSWKGRGNQYIEFVRVLYCKLPTNSKQLPAFPLEAVPGIEPRAQRWEARVLSLCHHGPFPLAMKNIRVILNIPQRPSGSQTLHLMNWPWLLWSCVWIHLMVACKIHSGPDLFWQ